MHTPTGVIIDENGKFLPISWVDIVFNPSFPFRYTHMLMACYLTTAFVVLGVGARYVLQGKFLKESKIMMNMAILLILILAPLQPIVGDVHGLNTLKHQPVKVSAMEGLWEDERGAGLKLFGIPDSVAEETKYAVEIPYLASLILTHDINGEVKGLKSWPKEERPPVATVFYGFRVMVGIGMLMILTAFVGAYRWYKGDLAKSPLYLRLCTVMTPSGFVAILAGWMVTEVGRQLYVIYGLLKTKDAISPSITHVQTAISLGVLVTVYSIVFGAGIYYLFKLLNKGPALIEQKEVFGEHSTVKRTQPIIDLYK